MGYRISLRARPRVDGIFGASKPISGTGDIGPFSTAQMMELLWRVKDIRFRWSVTWDGGTENITDTTEVTITRADDERQVMMASPYFGIQLDFSNGGGSFWSTPYAGATPTDGGFYRDGDNYWVAGSYDAIDTLSVGTGFGWSTAHAWDIPGRTLIPGVVLPLASGDVPFPLYIAHPGTFVSGTASIEITEWFPYAHINGSPFWNLFDGTRLPEQVPNTTNLLPLL